ncbi:MAG: hypothetical protein R6V41_02705 [Desulfobacteraceae bacterium]
MNPKLKALFSFLMITALVFGFADIYFPLEEYSFERLHVFLFNLCTGGTILLFYTRGQAGLTFEPALFFITSLAYALSAFLFLYPVTILLSFIMAAMVEKARIRRFSFLPFDFFKRSVPVSEKFHQASLLCLSMGLVISTLVILNNEYFRIIHLDKLKLDTFFLGFSFPLSLITLSVVFLMLDGKAAPHAEKLSEICFWTITAGVIVFFLFILLEMFIPQIFVTTALFLGVLTVFYLYGRYGEKLQQKHFLSSGIGFLITTAVTGIVYIFFQLSPGYDPEEIKWLLRIHVFASLYGWNLCGLAVICRFNDFPIRLHSKSVIAAHWVTALVLAPLGTFHMPFAFLAVTGYAFITITLFFSSNHKENLNDK